MDPSDIVVSSQAEPSQSLLFFFFPENTQTREANRRRRQSSEHALIQSFDDTLRTYGRRTDESVDERHEGDYVCIQ